MKKNGMKKWLAIAMASTFGVSMFACNGGTTGNTTRDTTDNGGDITASAEGYAYMAIDINPTVEFVLQADKVVSVDAVNDDAAVLVSEENFVGMTAEEATETVVELAEELGYLNEENANVKITVAADDERYEETLKEKVKNGAKRGSEIAKINSEPRNADKRKEKKLKDENAQLYEGLNPAKVRMIEAIMRYDDTMTFEIGAGMTFEELGEMLRGYVEEYKEFVGKEIREEYKASIEEKKQQTELEIADIYGEEFKTMMETYHALKMAYKSLEKKAENMVLLEEDVQSIIAILGLEDAQLISMSGVVTVESVDKYLDRYCIEEYATTEAEETALEDMENAVEDILDNYDEDEYVLTETDLAALEEVIGEAFELELGATLEDVEDLLEDVEETLEELKETVALDKEMKEEIGRKQEEMRDFKHEAHDEMKDRIEETKNEFKDRKEERKEFGKEGRVPPKPAEREEVEEDLGETEEEVAA